MFHWIHFSGANFLTVHISVYVLGNWKQAQVEEEEKKGGEEESRANQTDTTSSGSTREQSITLPNKSIFYVIYTLYIHEEEE